MADLASGVPKTQFTNGPMTANDSKAGEVGEDSVVSDALDIGSMTIGPKTKTVRDPEISASMAPVLIAALTKAKGWKAVWDECPHSAALGTDEPCVPCQNKAYEAAKEALALVEAKRGLSDELTLHAAFDLQYCLITSYRLSECDELLTRIFDVCKQRGTDDFFYTQEIQALAFLRYKQSRYEDACVLFEEMQTIVGPNERLLENMGHAYTSLGRVDKAEESFRRALDVIEEKERALQAAAITTGAPASELEAELAKLNKAGILFGMGVCLRSMRKLKEALESLHQSLSLYETQHKGKGDHSICAKVAGHVAETLQDLGRMAEADRHYREAVRVFRITCGDDSPLTCSALQRLGNFLLACGKYDEALSTLTEALERTVGVDVFSLRLKQVAELLASVTSLAEGLGPRLRAANAGAGSGVDGGAADEDTKDKGTGGIASESKDEKIARSERLVKLCKIADEKFRKMDKLPIIKGSPEEAAANAAGGDAVLQGFVFYKLFAEQCLAAGMSFADTTATLALPGPLATPAMMGL